MTPAGSHHPRKIIRPFFHDTEGVTYSGVLCVIRIRICSPIEGIYDPFRVINECSFSNQSLFDPAGVTIYSSNGAGY